MGKIVVNHNVSNIKGLCVIKPKMFMDNRGYFMETYNKEEFIEEGLVANFVQDNEVHSVRGVLRGIHVNKNHPQGKLIRVLRGKIFDVAIDLRKDSITYKNWYGIELSSDNYKQLYIPEGFGHGYLALTDSDILFKVTTHYIKDDEIGFAWNSRELSIQWPIIDSYKYLLNQSDANNLDFSLIDF